MFIHTASAVPKLKENSLIFYDGSKHYVKEKIQIYIDFLSKNGERITLRYGSLTEKS